MCEGLVVASLITRVEANHFDTPADHVATVGLAHEVMLLAVGYVVLVLALVVPSAADTTTRVPGVFAEVRRCQRECHRDRFGVFSQAKADASNLQRRASRCVVATWLADKEVED